VFQKNTSSVRAQQGYYLPETGKGWPYNPRFDRVPIMLGDHPAASDAVSRPSVRLIYLYGLSPQLRMKALRFTLHGFPEVPH
jgi:hypothetical protein